MLAVGNILNDKTPRGGAYGFNLNSLLKFADMRSKSISLLDFIV